VFGDSDSLDEGRPARDDGGYDPNRAPDGLGHAIVALPPPACQWFSYLAAALDRRSAARLALVFVGAVLARGRRTVTSWIRAAGLSAEYKPVYTTVAAAGKQSDSVAARLALAVVKPLVAGAGRLTLPSTIRRKLAGMSQNHQGRRAGHPRCCSSIWL
jgi:hypothetical protein